MKNATALMDSHILLKSGEHRWMHSLLRKGENQEACLKSTDNVHINFDIDSGEKEKKEKSCEKMCQFCTGMLSGYRFISHSILMLIYWYILSWWVYMKNSALQALFNEWQPSRDVENYSVIFSQMAMPH